MALLDALPSVPNLILIITGLTLYFAYYLKTKCSYWEKRGVPHMDAGSSLINTIKLMLQRAPLAFNFQQIYKELDGHKFGGYYRFTRPSLIIRDPELIRTILVKNFFNFHDRFPHKVDEELNPLANHIVSLTGLRWRNIRYKLIPTFSSGKLRLMDNLMRDCIKELDEYLNNAINESSETGDIHNVYELMGKYATDVIGSCAFGLKCNSIRDSNSEFRRIGKLSVTPTYRTYARTILRILSPRLVSFLKIKEHNPKVEEFFNSVLEQAVKHRESGDAKRNDFMQLLINIQAEEKAQLKSNGHQQKQNGDRQNENQVEKKDPSEDCLFTNSIVASNAFVFFVAGFDTTATTLSYCLYELALNPEVAEKMCDEVESVKRSHNGGQAFDNMKELVYMEAVIAETLRKYPVGSIIIRYCTEPFQMPDSPIIVEKGTPVNISVYGLHHDPKYFPEPEKFLPERFSEENKGSIVPGSYLPFGDGPRACIGMRFAQFEMKSVLSHLVSNYTFHPCEKTAIPLKFDSRSALHKPLGGIWIRFQRRSRI